MGNFLSSFFGGNLLFVFLSFVVFFGLVGLAIWFLRRPPLEGTRSARGPRLAVVESLTLDSKRHLVLVRRDNVEHLLLVGGPSDLVVEPNISRTRPAQSRPAAGRGQPATAATSPPQPAPPPPAAYAAARLRSLRADKASARSEAATRGDQRAKRRKALPTRQPPAPTDPTRPEAAAAAERQPESSLQAALAAADSDEAPRSTDAVTITEAEPPAERYKEDTSPFAPGGPIPASSESGFTPRPDAAKPPAQRAGGEEPIRPPPSEPSPADATESSEPNLEKDMARLLGQISPNEPPERG
ncbi:flagellar biosynthetic protein FliO [Bauldia sp.]|uniref:flagellar biosynthetic protein FliO n=1 Tax=Bauldia sp. TaxID=2575872 RepID=UPI003BAB31F3